MYPISTFGTVFIVTIQAILYRDHALLGNVTTVIHIQIENWPGAQDRLQEELDKLGLKPCGAKYERTSGGLSIEFQLDHLPCREQELAKLLAPLMKQPYIKSLFW